MSKQTVLPAGTGKPLAIIAGLNVLESKDLALTVGSIVCMIAPRFVHLARF